MKRNTLIAVCAAMSILVTGISACSNAASEGGAQQGQEAQDFTLRDLQGNSVRLSDFKGRKVLIVFGATWCSYCVREVPQLNALLDKHKDKTLKILSVDIRERASTVASFAKKYGVKYTILLDEDGSVAKQYNVTGIPANILVNEKGAIEYRGHEIPSNL